MARPKLDLERIKRELPTANDYLDTEYGIQGTPEREEFSKNALAYYNELTKEKNKEQPQLKSIRPKK